MNTSIRVRACVAVIDHQKLIMVPHYGTDVGPVQWHIPGGGIDFGESLREAALREFFEETGLQASIDHLLDVSEVIKPEQPWHSITVTFHGTLHGGQIKAEVIHPFASSGDKTPHWFSWEELQTLHYHPLSAVKAAFRMQRNGENLSVFSK
jgi:8-oxo-dGTP diphosphatase